MGSANSCAATVPEGDTSATEDKEVSHLLKHPSLWRAGQIARSEDAHSTGFSELDQLLWGQGWPRAGLTEILPEHLGIGELRLLMPLLRHLSHGEQRWVGWLNPPAIPYAPALEALGVDVSKMLLIHPRDHQDAVWALEQACRSGSCSAMLAWLDERKLEDKDTRRLQLAARHGGCSLFLFRPPAAGRRSSMAELRLTLHPSSGLGAGLDRVDLTLLKRRGGWPVSDIHVDLGSAPVSYGADAIEEQLSLWRRRRPNDTGLRWLPAESNQQTVHR